jgi:hypothetical protein
VELPTGLRPGLVWLEVQRGCLLSAPNHLLVCPPQGLADELNAASGAHFHGPGSLTLEAGLLMAAKFQSDAAALRPLASRYNGNNVEYQQH